MTVLAARLNSPVFTDVDSCREDPEILSIPQELIACLGTWSEVAPGMSQLRYKGEAIGARLHCPQLGNAYQDIQITQIDLNLCRLVIEGNPEGISRFFYDSMDPAGSVAINGGFYNVNQWYQPAHALIGLIKTTQYDNTESIQKDSRVTVFRHPMRSSFSSLASQGSLTPALYRDCYGVFQIDSEGVGVIRQIELDAQPDRLKSASYCLASAPVLVSSGDVTFLEEHLRQKRFQWREIYERFGDQPAACPPGSLYHADQHNPRSAIGISQDGKKVYFVTVRGRHENVNGLTLPQMALLMKRLGCHHALNLDGGISAAQRTRRGDNHWEVFSSSASSFYGALTLPSYIVASIRPSSQGIA